MKELRGDLVIGETGTYILTVRNIGGVPTSGTVTVTDPIPDGLTLLLPVVAPVDWDCSGSTATDQHCTYEDPIAPGDPPHVFRLTVSVDGPVGAVIDNTAFVETDGDVDISNNEDDVRAPIRPPPAPAAALSSRGLAVALLTLLGIAWLRLRYLRRGRA